MSSLKTSTKIAAAVATALAAPAVFALPPSAPNYVIYSAGGSAEANPVVVAACSVLTSVDSYTDAGTGGADSSSYRVLYGLWNGANSGSLVAGTTKVMVIYKFNGGSYPNGAVPQVTAGASLPFPSLASIEAASLVTGSSSPGAGNACAATGNPATAGHPSYFYSAVNETNSVQPQWGITDVESGLFSGFNNPNVLLVPAVSTAPVTPANTDKIYDLVEGVAVTANLYTVKKVWSKQEVAGILDGTIYDWSQLYNDTGSPLAAGGIYLVDRNFGSGTKAAGNEYFLGYPALSPAGLNDSPVSYSTFGSTLAAYTPSLVGQPQDIVVSSSTAQVTQLQSINALTGGGSAAYGISVLSEDTPPAQNQVGGANAYDFVAINGEYVDTNNLATDSINGVGGTSYINAIKGSYDFFYQPHFNFRNNYSSTDSNVQTIDNALLAVFKSSGITGISSSLAFPKAAAGTLVDSDIVGTIAAGVTLATRGGNSSALLLPSATITGITPGTLPTLPVGHDPL